jgi:hypothetical protein
MRIVIALVLAGWVAWPAAAQGVFDSPVVVGVSPIESPIDEPQLDPDKMFTHQGVEALPEAQPKPEREPAPVIVAASVDPQRAVTKPIVRARAHSMCARRAHLRCN